MKLQKLMLCMLLVLICTASMAQVDTRPKLFSAYPQTISLDQSLISNTFSFQPGTTVSVVFTPTFTFTGNVISNTRIYENLWKVMIRAADAKTVFEINRIANSDQSFSYTGRIINNAVADGYEIKNNNGIYSLQKFETVKILEPCGHL